MSRKGRAGSTPVSRIWVCDGMVYMPSSNLGARKGLRVRLPPGPFERSDHGSQVRFPFQEDVVSFTA